MPHSVQYTTLWAECQRSYKAYAPQILREKLSGRSTACKYTNFYKRDEFSQKDKAWRSLTKTQRENFSLYTSRSFLWLEGEQVASNGMNSSFKWRNALLNLGSSLQNLFEVYVFENKKLPAVMCLAFTTGRSKHVCCTTSWTCLKCNKKHPSLLQIKRSAYELFLINNVKCSCNHKITLQTKRVN